MTSKLKMAVIALLMTVQTVQAQVDSTSSTNTDISSDTPIDYQDTWQSPFILDEMTLDPEQNRSWRMGDYRYSSKPKHSWEFGFHLGHFFIDGDVDKNLLGGYGLGLHLRKALNYTLSIRASLFYGQATGMEAQPSRHKNNTGLSGVGGGLVEKTFEMYDPMRGGPGEWFPAYMTNYISGDISAIFNIGNLLFHRERNKWNLYFGLGVGLNTHDARLDLLDSNGLPYDGVRELIGWTPEEFDTKSGRDRIKSELTDLYDADYETAGYKKAGIFRIGDEMNVHFVLIPSIGLTRKINKRFNISLEHLVYLSDNDYLDGIKFRTALDQTNNIDVGHYTNVRIGVNIGNFQKVTEPLYWLNPIDQAFNDIANLKNQEDLDFSDEDNDGVIDLLDKELDTPEDCPVDTRGVILDSDGDGIVDCEDKEPYSRPGCPVDEFGIAECDADNARVNADEINAIMDQRFDEFRSEIPALVDEYASVYNLNPVISNPDGSQSFTEKSSDGSETVTNEYDDGSVENITTNPDGSSSKLVKSADDKVSAEFVDSEGVTSKVNYNADGTQVSQTENLDGSITKTSVDKNGRIESETKYLDGTTDLVIKNLDGSIISEHENPDGSRTMSTKLSDGTVKSHTKYIDGTSVRIEKDVDGNIVRTKRTLDGIVKTTRKGENGDLITRIERPDGPSTKVTQKVDGTLINATDFPDGSYSKSTQKPNGEILFESVDADGILTNIKQRPDGSQRIVKSSENAIISDQEVSKEDSRKLIRISEINELMIPEEPKDPKVFDLPDVKEIPENIEVQGNNSVAAAEKENNLPVTTNLPPVSIENAPVNVIHTGCGNWFLPMIHYDLNKFAIKAQYYSHLHNVAQVMKKCPEVCVVAQGHTDTRHTNDYNTILSYRRAKAAVDYLTDTYEIDRSRLKLMYGGEESPMVMTASSEAHHFMNRRVEFRTCETGDADMEAPKGYKELEQKQEQKQKNYTQGSKASGY